MKSIHIWTVMVSIAAVALIAGPVSAQSTTSESVKDEVALRAASEMETVQGDLKGAIERYKAIAQSKDRAIAARALVRMAECYQKLGDAESRRIYEQVVKEFADQKEAVAIARARLGNETGIGESRMSFRQLYDLPKDGGVAGAISRDGRYLPYVDWSDNGNLYLHDFASKTNRRLTDTATDSMPEPKIEQFAVDASISRDGGRLAYTWFRGDVDRFEIRVLDLSGDGVPQSRLLFKSDEVAWAPPLDWSPDGKSIAVGIQRVDKTAQIGLLSVADGSLRVLKSVDWRGSTMLVFSPDGKYLAHDLPARGDLEQRDVYVLAVDGSREIPAIVSPSQDVVIGWSNDGSRLLFASDRGGSIGLWSIRFSAGKIDGAPELLRRDIGELSSLGFTEAGKLYAKVATPYPGQLTDVHVASIDFVRGKLLSPPMLAAQSFVGENLSPAWSPDGKYLAYASRRRSIGPHHYVFVIRSLETGEVREVSPNPAIDQVGSLIWAPDGRSLITNRRDVKGRYGIFRVDAQTGSTSILVEQKDGEAIPSLTGISPDGTKLYYSTRYWGSGYVGAGNSPTVHVSLEKDLTTGSVKEFHRDAHWTFRNLSPDGQYLLGFDPSKKGWMSVLRTASGEVFQRKFPSGRGFGWAPDSGAVYRISAPGDIWRLPIEGGEPEKVELKSDFGELLFGAFRVHPDGQRIAFETRTPSKPQEVWVLENFLPAPVAANK